MTTVKQLIEHLQTLPQGSPVIYRNCSDWSLLDLGDVVAQRATVELKPGVVIRHHNIPDEYREYSGPWEYKGKPLPTPAEVVTFPGK